MRWVGNGKTRLSFALIRLFIEAYNDYKALSKDVVLPIRVKFGEMFNGAWDKDNNSIDKFCSCKLLLIDDFLTKNIDSKGYQDVLYRILDTRYEGILPTIFTANYNEKELKNKLGVRDFDRLINANDIYEVRGKSVRSRFDKQILD